jgi:predicted transcriptional regulator of viral defense system
MHSLVVDKMLGVCIYFPRGLSIMANASKAVDSARKVFSKRGGMLRTVDALRLGIHPRTLYKLRDRGELERVGRGLYRLSTAPHLTNPDWVTVAIRAPNAVVCLISALAHHGMTTQVPHTIDLAIPSHGQIPKVDALPIRVFWYSEPAFSAGVELVRIDEVSVRIYSAAKTVADCFKYRNKIGLDIAVEALRRFRELKKKPDFRELVRYARICRVERIMRPYLEATL